MGTFKASLQFLKRLDLYKTKKPFQILMPIPEDAGDRRTDNLEFEDKEQTLYDMREATEKLTLDSHGFEYMESIPAWLPSSTSSRKDIEELYLPSVEKLIKSHVDDVDEIFFFDWRVSG